MKRSIPLLFLCFATALPAVSAEKEYPLHVQLLESTWTQNGFGSVLGRGRGNVTDAESTRGFDFSYDCVASYNTTAGNFAYPGRWKKPEQRLVIQGLEIGGKRKTDCEMKTTLLHDVYSRKNGQLFVIPQEQFKNVTESLRPPDKDPAHYQMKISILSADWQPATLGSIGSGKGDVVNGDNVEGFNFASNCAVTFQAGSGLYAAKWKEEKAKLILITKAIGENQLYTCELKVDMIAGVYLRNNNTGVINQLTQDQFKTSLNKRPTAQTPPPRIPANAPTTLAKVNVVSDPDGADIEVDGKYVGSTPSVLEWPVGEHTVIVRKPGYANWTRKLTLVTGEVKVNANLEKAGSN